MLLAIVGCTVPSEISTTTARQRGEEQIKEVLYGTAVVQRTIPAAQPLAWAPCADDATWECATIQVPIDYDSPEATLGVAINRKLVSDPANRLGSLLFNPGGPGGSGRQSVIADYPALPAEFTEYFDIVGFDPRGVGESTPLSCVIDDHDGTIQCDDASQALLPFLGAVNVARDMEMIRRSLGDEPLNFVGYSYGTIVGALYANMFPEQVRTMILDGAVDPRAGAVNAPLNVQPGYYAQQDFEGTLYRYFELCDISEFCALGEGDTESAMRALVESPTPLNSPHFAPDEPVSGSAIFDVAASAMYDPSVWPMLTVALQDARGGDASTLMALQSWLNYGYPRGPEHVNDGTHLAISCADFADRSSQSYCVGVPEADEPLPRLSVVDLANPVLVIGTEFDPATPVEYAEDMVEVLGDAAMITWDGAGHTALMQSGCIRDAAVAYLIDATLPQSNTGCPFVDGLRTDEEVAEVLFSPASPEFVNAVVTPVFAQTLQDENPECLAGKLANEYNEQLLTYARLGVDNPRLQGFLKRARDFCL